MRRLGLRISERMAGWIQFFPEDGLLGTQIQYQNKYPFDFTIHAYTTKFFQYPFLLKFKGVAKFPGLPLKEETSFDQRSVPIHGSMEISLKGVAYKIYADQSLFGSWSLVGKKVYKYFPFSYQTFRHSLIFLAADIKHENKTIAKSETKYLLPLWHFPFGLRLTFEAWGHRPQGYLASRLYQIALFLFPDHKELGAKDQLIKSIEGQLAFGPYFVYMLLYWDVNFIRLLSRLIFFKSLGKLTPAEGQRLLEVIKGNALLKLIFMPLTVTILYPLFAQPKYLEQKGQNIITPPKVIEHEPWMAQSFAPCVQDGATIDADCVVIGSGAGGAAFAYEMAKQGKAVVILEEGHYFKRQDLKGLAAEMMRKLYQNSGIQFSLSNSALWIPTGKCVGGTTFINSGTCIRTPKEVLDRWKNQLGLDLSLDKYFPLVEDMMGGAPPVPSTIQGGIARVFAKGLKGSPYSFGPLRRAEIGCDGQSYCISGCPTGAKRSTAVSFIPEALKRNAFLFSHMRAKKILFENKKAVGVKACVPGFGDEFSVNIKAKLVVLAAGTFGTPQILYRSGIHKSNKHIGRHLTIHPALTAGGIFSEIVREKFFVPQSLGVFGIEKGDYVLEGYTLPVDVIGAAMGQWGNDLSELMSQVNYFTNFSVMLKDQSEGRLILTPWGEIPAYHVNQELIKNALHGLNMIGEIFFKAGARKVYMPIQNNEVINSMEELHRILKSSIHAGRLVISAHHPLGTCRMAENEKKGVVGGDGEMFGINNLVIADGSTIPGPLGVNPQVTIMANALRMAELWSQRI